MTLSYALELPTERLHLPKHVQIAQAIADDITRGRLRNGEKLPGSRSLAKLLGVHRNTVNAALDELTAQGLIDTLPARGVFVRGNANREARARRAPAQTRAAAIPEQPRFALAPSQAERPMATRDGGLLYLTGGTADPRLFPREVLARAYRRAFVRNESALDYSNPYGAEPLRRALADMLCRTRGLTAEPRNVLVTRGSQQALWLCAHALLQPGDRVGVEAFGYPPAWAALRSAGAELVPLSIDQEGVRIDAIEQALAQRTLRALYLTPHHQYPTMVPLSPSRRAALLALAHRHRIAILEDDYTHEFQFEGRPRLPLASADASGCVVYIGTLSKILAPGLRVGYAVGPEQLIQRMAAKRQLIDRQGDNIAELVVADLISEGELARHARRMRNVYYARRALLIALLRETLGERIRFDVPQGGMNLWVEVRGKSADGWAARAAEKGVWIRPGSELHFDGSKVPFVRMGFTRLDEAELRVAVQKIGKAW